MSEDQQPDNEQFRLHVEISTSESDEIVIKQPMLGMSPYILIYPEWDHEESMAVINLSACDFTVEELVGALRDIADTLEENPRAGE